MDAKTDTTASFGASLKGRRLAAGLTQEALAERAGMSARAIQSLERGASRPLRGTVERLAAALRLEPEARAVFLAAAPPAPRRTRGAAIDVFAAPLVPFVGRARELALMRRHLAGEGPPVLFVAGEPGIGKTRLLREAAAHAAAGGWVVLAGSCRRQGAQEPYAPLLGALERHIQGQAPARARASLRDCAWLARLLPELAGGLLPLPPAETLAPEQERRLMFAAAARYVHNVAGPAGTLLVLDDLQWAGTDALDLLTALLHVASIRGTGLPRAADIPPLRVAAAYRDTEAPPDDPLAALLADLAQAGLARRQALGPLTPEEAGRLLDDVLVGMEEVGGALRERVLTRAEGMPFFIVSFGQGLRARGARGENETGDAALLPWDLTQGVRQRLAALSPQARMALAAAAVIGRRAPRGLLVDVVALPEEEAHAALDAACRARLLVESGADAYQVAHDVIREVVEADLGAARRAALHRRSAVALERAPEGEPRARVVEALAYHYARAGDVEKAALYLERAGDRARGQQAYAAARAYYAEAVERLDGLGWRRDAACLRYKLGGVLRLDGRHHADALAALEEAAEMCRAADDWENVGRAAAEIGLVYLAQGEAEEGIRRLTAIRRTIAAGSAAAPDMDTDGGATVLDTTLAQLYHRASRYAEYHAVIERVAAPAQTTDDAAPAQTTDDAALAADELGRGLALLTTGRALDGEAALDRGSQLAESSGDLAALVSNLTNAAAFCLMTARFDLAADYATRAATAATRTGDIDALAFIHFLQGSLLYYHGQGDDAYAVFERGVALTVADGPRATSHYPLLGLGVLALAREDIDAASAYLERGARLAQQGDALAAAYFQGTLAERDLLAGRAAQALERLQPLRDMPEQPGVTPFVLVRLANTLLELGEIEDAATQAARAVAHARTSHTPTHLVDGLVSQARARARGGSLDLSVEALAEARVVARRIPYALGEARALQALGALNARQGDVGVAREQLERACALYQRLGAHAKAATLAQTLVSLPHEHEPAATPTTDVELA